MKKIAIIPNYKKDTDFACTKKVIKCLEGKAEIFADEALKGSLDGVAYIPYDELFEAAECMIVLGGDGTMLRIAARCAQRDIPVLGINLGKVGFLTEIEPENIQTAINHLLKGEYNIEKRMLMKSEIYKKNGDIISDNALNDVVVLKNADSKIINIMLYTDGELVNEYVADGIIIATPTGSTGYSISAGGPVADPLMELYIATPICPHMLSVRSAVLSAQKEIVIKLKEGYTDNNAVVSDDGRTQGTISPDDEIHISKSKYSFSIIKIQNNSFYKTVLSKLS